MRVLCARCGAEYDNPRVKTQREADLELEICPDCEDYLVANELRRAENP